MRGKPTREARRAEKRKGSWGGGSSPPHQLGGLRERCKLPQWGPGHSLGELAILYIFKIDFEAPSGVILSHF